MKYIFRGIVLIAIIIFFSIPSVFADTPNGKTWDAFTDINTIQNGLQIDGLLTVEAGTVLDSIEPINVTINGPVNFKTGSLPIKISNINFIINMGAPDESLINNLDLIGSMTFLSGKVNISQSQFHSPNETALEFTNTTFTLSKNDITNSDIGVKVESGSSGSIQFCNIHNNNIGVLTNSQSVTINRNNIFQNSIQGVQGDDSLVSAIDATQNWWGCPTGPIFQSLDDNPCQVIYNVNYPQFLTGQIVTQLNVDDIAINEIYPHSINDPMGEWIELINNLDYPITLFDLIIQDITVTDGIDGKVYSEVIPQITLPSKITTIITDREIGNGLSNTDGKLQLIYNDIEFPVIHYKANFTTNQSYSYFPDGWQVTIPTPGTENQKTPVIPPPPPPPPPVVPPPTTPPNSPPPTPNSTCPATLKISELKNNINCRVTITGTVKRPSGSTFYLDDGTGEIKIYLQSSKNIKKPRLYTGTKLQVAGIIDNYRTGLRLLPESSADIQIIKDEAKTSTISKTKTTTTAAKTSTPSLSETPQTLSSELQTINSQLPIIIPEAKAQVKGIQTTPNTSIPGYASLKIVLIFATMLLIAISSYNIGIKHGINQSKS